MLRTLRNLRDGSCLCYICLKKKKILVKFIYLMYLLHEGIFSDRYKCLQPFIFLKFDTAG